MNVLSLFSGIGGLDLAAEWAGMKTVAFCERDKFCQKVLKKHWPDVPCFDDVTTLKGSDINESVDLITGGFPCQPFSKAGKKLGVSDDRHLWPEYFRLIQELRPSWVVGENVVGIINMALDNVLADLESIGYATRTFDIPASAVGASHQRRRVFIVAHAPQLQRDGGRHYTSQCSQSESFPEPRDGSWSALASDPISRKFALGWKHAGMGRFGELATRDRTWVSECEPGIRGGTDGIPDYLDRLKSLGNAVVPQQAYPIFKAIADLEAA